MGLLGSRATEPAAAALIVRSSNSAGTVLLALVYIPYQIMRCMHESLTTAWLLFRLFKDVHDWYGGAHCGQLLKYLSPHPMIIPPSLHVSILFGGWDAAEHHTSAQHCNPYQCLPLQEIRTWTLSQLLIGINDDVEVNVFRHLRTVEPLYAQFALDNGLRAPSGK